MQIQLPSPQQIYDLSTQQLSKLKAQIQHNINNKSKSQSNNVNLDDEVQSLKQLLQNIELQIQERKTIQFFTQLCINDGTANKYVKEITNFNNQFKKLANQLLNNQQNHLQNNYKLQTNPNQHNFNKNNSHNFNKYQKENQNFSKYQEYQKQLYDRQSSKASITTDQFSKENHNIGTQTSDFTNSTASDMTKKAGQTITKKMGLGHSTNTKKSKNAMQQFIKATLAKSKGVDYVSTKGGTIKKSPQKIGNNASHLSTNHQQGLNTPLSTTKSIKPASQGSESGSTRKQVQSSNKNIPSQKSINEKDRDSLIKKRNEVIEKIKTMKKPQTHSGNQNHPPQIPKKKNIKGMDSKSLVEMVKQQEDAKKKREQDQLQGIVRPKKIKNQLADNKTDIYNQKLSQIVSEKVSNMQNKINEETEQKNSKFVLKQATSRAEEKQNQFPIKQEINAISSSDTQSDSDSVRVNRKQKKKGTFQKKEQTYYSIPEQQIEQSIVILKQPKPLIQDQQSSIIKQGQVRKKEVITRQIDLNRIKSPKQDETLISKQVQKLQVKISKKNLKDQVFGKITQEEYNPDGYEKNRINDDNNDQRQQKDNNNIVNNQEVQQQQNEDIQNQYSLNKQQDIKSIKSVNEQKYINKQKQQTKKESNIKKQKSKKTVIDQQIISPALSQFQNTKMYNQQYWLHIKQQAQSKVLRFKQQKQLQRKQRQLKAILIQQQSKKIKSELSNKKNNKSSTKPDQSYQKSTNQPNTQQQNQTLSNQSINKEQNIINLQQDVNDNFIKQQKDNLKKIYTDNNINGSSKKSSKKPSNTIIRQPKLSYPRPQFNYLQIYPTFNHIFNIFYTKPSNQAILDIPLVMKQLIQMFQSHIDYQKSKTNNFRSAIFLPFDNRNSKINQFNDARQLLQHAQTTYINLKTLIQRVQIFNSNIQGEFQNCTQQQKQNTQFYRVVKTKQQVYDIISTSFLRRKGWKQLPHGQNLKANWNLFWSWSKPQIDMNKLLTFQRINHYPFNKNLSRKDLLYKNIDYFRKTHKVSFPFLPLTFNLPKQFTQFSKRFHQEQLINRQKNYWIMKPIGKSRGRGIKLINSLGDLNYLDNIVVQKYIANPLLIDGYKFDMRIYVLVTSFHPLEAFVYRQGFARFSTAKYSLQPMDMKNNFVHLTNFAINRHNQQANDQFSGGSKISLKSLKQRVTKMGYSFASVWSQVHQIIIKSLLACSVTVPPFPAAFQLFGYDIMMDDTGQCSLIEINASPSLQRSYMIDDIIKQSLIDDIVQIVNPPIFSKQQAINVMNERLAPDFRHNKKGGQKGFSPDEEDMIHLARILKYQKIRKYGQMPEKIGLFEMVAPSPMSKDLQKLIKSKSGINAPHNID